ncbi:MAG: MerR family DNA-binding transcriptional regulator [Chloroflexi bacterium]|nr:MerR family DNA-binding transcriptional regulator [Chloroflexota bacterium]
MTAMTISQLAHRSGVPATTLRYYEKAGILPQPPRTDAGYRRYDDTALARVGFLQRARTLGIQLSDIAELVRLWDGDRCEPVQDQLRAMVHAQRMATRERLDVLTHLAADLDAVGTKIGADDACGPSCACMASPSARSNDRMVGACCKLGAADLPERLADWRRLRDRATSIEERASAVRLTFSSEVPMEEVARLVELESACCTFYRFTMEVDGEARSMTVDAGPNGTPAVRGLLGLGT